ncbi:MAG: serine O-acetyltransferase [Oscillospiraceae bacterium]|nr:serine O-acetyltransferase [Oscillospiraceae bacterium]
MSYKLGFVIPPNVFGAGLRINHYGNIVVNSEARIGDWCDIHQGVNIGAGYDGVPTLGNNVWIGPGAKIFGKIQIADDCAIGANAVVNKDFLQTGVSIAGVPAKIISEKGNQYIRS